MMVSASAVAWIRIMTKGSTRGRFRHCLTCLIIRLQEIKVLVLPWYMTHLEALRASNILSLLYSIGCLFRYLTCRINLRVCYCQFAFSVPVQNDYAPYINLDKAPITFHENYCFMGSNIPLLNGTRGFFKVMAQPGFHFLTLPSCQWW